MRISSPLAWSALTRLLCAALLVALLWLATFWALDWTVAQALSARPAPLALMNAWRLA